MEFRTRYGVFSEENIKKVWKEETRKGKQLIDLFPELNDKSKRMSDIRKKLRMSISSYPINSPGRKSAIRRLRRTKRLHAKYFNNKLDEEIVILSRELINLVNSQDFGWKLFPVSGSPKSIINSEHPRAIYKFLDLCIKYHLSGIFQNPQISRDEIILQMKNILNSPPSFTLIKGDISSFYENIDHNLLRKKILSSSQVSGTVKFLVTKLLEEYAEISGRDSGIPRGLSLSSALSEIYIKGLDDKIISKISPDYYFRFVDDFIIIKYGYEDLSQDIKSNVFKLVESENLKINEDKTFGVFHALDNRQEKIYEFDYLGYKFKVRLPKQKEYRGKRLFFNPEILSIDISDKKFERYKYRINKAFEVYSKEISYPYAINNLYSRIVFLTGNTSFNSYRSKKFIGAYYNNKFITSYKESRLFRLDCFLKGKISYFENFRSLTFPQQVKDLSFEKGFNQRAYKKISHKKIHHIKKVWSDDT